jgi:hypothetical protein
MPNKHLRFSDVAAEAPADGEPAAPAAPAAAAAAGGAAMIAAAPAPGPPSSSSSSASAPHPEGEAIQVYLRVRPLTEKEAEVNPEPTISVASDNTIQMKAPEVRVCPVCRHPPSHLPPHDSPSPPVPSPPPPPSPQASHAFRAGEKSGTFTFSRVFEPSVGQDSLYAGAFGPVVTRAVNEGHHGLLFAYGAWVSVAGRRGRLRGPTHTLSLTLSHSALPPFLLAQA